MTCSLLTDSGFSDGTPVDGLTSRCLSFRNATRRVARPRPAGVAALAEPVRRQLYDVVAGADDAVSREQAAQQAGVPVHTAKFHLDKLVDEGLLEVEYRRLTGRTGPGSGRPAKLYRRADRELTVSLPARQYDLLSRILASAVATATTSGEPVADVAAAVARAEGARSAARIAPRSRSELRRLADALAAAATSPASSSARSSCATAPSTGWPRSRPRWSAGSTSSTSPGLRRSRLPRRRDGLEPAPTDAVSERLTPGGARVSMSEEIEEGSARAERSDARDPSRNPVTSQT